MGLGTFLLVQVGRAIIRIRPAELAKTLRRFKGSKQIKKPTDAQVDKSQKINKDLDNFNKADRKIVVEADKARPTIVQSLTGTGRGSGQTTIKGIKTGESRRNTVKNVATGIGSLTTGAGGTYMLMKDKDKKKTTKSKTKTYAEMVKEDKAKGKGKVLARRQALPTSPKNKNRKEDPPKDSKKKVKPVEKKVVKKKVEEKKNNSTQLYMKKDGKDTLVKFNSRGGMLKKGKK